MSKTVFEAVQEICLSFPETEERISHGRSNFSVRGKAFAIYSLNHHGDGRVALLLNAAKGAQDLYVEMAPDCYFIPSYVGSKGWVGVVLNKGLTWTTIAKHAYEAYDLTAPPGLRKLVDRAPRIKPPDVALRPQDINPFLRKRAAGVLNKLRALCEALPETSSFEPFGNPAWKAGKKTFVSVNYYGDRLGLQFWVGLDKQSLLTMDERFSIPMYTGKNGWINLDVEDRIDWAEVEALLMDSYKHFALKRMLSQLPQ